MSRSSYVAKGRVMVKALPCTTSLVQVTVPPWASVERLDDRQSETGSAVVAAASVVGAVEAIEDLADVFGSHARAGVLTVTITSAWRTRTVIVIGDVVGRVDECIGQQVGQDLTQP